MNIKTENNKKKNSQWMEHNVELNTLAPEIDRIAVLKLILSKKEKKNKNCCHLSESFQINERSST